jgi:sulfur-oxidizing protein SoxY
MSPTMSLRRLTFVASAGLILGLALTAMPARSAGSAGSAEEAGFDPADPFRSLPWADMRRTYLGADARVVFDERVQVSGPGFAEDPMNVPITVAVKGLAGVRRIVVLVDRNPIRQVLEYQPQTAAGALPAVSFRFKLEQASPVRAAALAADGLWHVGSAWVDSSGGGCTVSGASRKDGSWTQTLGLVSGRVFDSTPVPGSEGGERSSASRLRLKIMHPMDTGLVGGIPAFHLTRLQVQDATGRDLLKLQTFEPVSENPVFSFDFAERPPRPLRIVGVDNNGNRIQSELP